MPDQGLQTFWKGADDGAVLDYHGRGPYAWSGPGCKRLRSPRLKIKKILVLTKYLVCLCERSAGSAVTGASCDGADGGGEGEGVGEGVGGGNGLGGERGEEAVESLRRGRRNVGLCLTVWGVVEGWQRFVSG